MKQYDYPVTLLGRGYEIKHPDREVDIILPDSCRKGHFFCFGTTRVGKTRIIENMVEQDIRKGYSVVVVDPKGDVELCSKIIQIAFEERRHEELMVISPIFPRFSATIDPLAYYYMPEELVGHIVSGIEVGQNDAFFYNVAYEISLVIVQALILLSRHMGRPPIFNLNDVKNLISQTEIRKLKEQVDTIVDDPEAVQLSMDMQKIVESPQDYYSKVSSSLRVALMELTTGNIGRIIGKADENRFIRRLEEGKRVIVIVQLGSLITRKAAYTLGKVFVSMIQSFVGRVYASGRKITPALCVYLDEAQNVLYRGIEDIFAKAGGADVWVHGFAQSINQLHAAVGQEFGNSILDNANTKLFMRVPDHQTAEYVAGHFGLVKKYSPIMHVGGGMAVRETEEDVVRPQDILGLPAREFYFTTYATKETASGMFKARSYDVSEANLEVEFPKASSALM